MSSPDSESTAETISSARRQIGLRRQSSSARPHSSATTPAQPHICYSPNIGAVGSSPASRPATAGTPLNTNGCHAATSGMEVESDLFGGVPSGPRRRNTRAMTFRNVDNFSGIRPDWQPGAEPGIDTSKPDGGRATLTQMQAPSEITVVDFSQSDFSLRHLNNVTLAAYLDIPRPVHLGCRWINVNGLSWDVIQILGNYKKLHRLAIEDLMNTRNRTKADWYPTHAFVVLTLQKLIHVDGLQSLDDAGEFDDDEIAEVSTPWARLWAKLRRRAKKRLTAPSASAAVSSKTLESGQQGPQSASLSGLSDAALFNDFRTLQRYHASPNDTRTEFMEKHSVLSSRNLVVAAEQVSIFVTSDNTVISFFELSAQDVEVPILKRLRMSDTSLRLSCDASMVAQAILDAIVDLAIPVAACYGDVIADLELDVLTRPSVNHTKSLYITISEINKVLSFVNPIMNLINTIRDHKKDNVGIEDLTDPDKGVIISPTTYVYLADVLDHCVLLTETLEQVKGQADNMISLIFNTISAFQNESMKQLTIVTIIFLPLTFLTGYFGQNFKNFSNLDRGIPFFWEIAGPVIFFTAIILMREMITDYVSTMIQRRHIVSLKNHRRKNAKRRG